MTNRFQLHDQDTLNEEVRTEISQQRPVVVVHGEWMFGDYLNPLLLESVRERVSIHLFQMPISQILVNGVSRLPHDVTQLEDGVPSFHRNSSVFGFLMCPLCFFVANLS